MNNLMNSIIGSRKNLISNRKEEHDTLKLDIDNLKNECKELKEKNIKAKVEKNEIESKVQRIYRKNKN